MASSCLRSTALLATCLVAGACATMNPCGQGRLDVKTLNDIDAERVQHDPTTVSSVAEQTALPALTVGATTPRRESEMQVYRIDALLTGYRLMPDGDLLLMLRDLNGPQTMVAEIPDPNCPTVERTSRSALYTVARSWIANTFGAPEMSMRRIDPPRPITLTGVGLYDLPGTGIEGAAVNNREISPVLRIGLLEEQLETQPAHRRR